MSTFKFLAWCDGEYSLAAIKDFPKMVYKNTELLLLLTGQLCLRRRTATVVQSTVHTQLAVTVAV